MAPHDNDRVKAGANEVVEKDALPAADRLAGGFPFQKQKAATPFAHHVGIGEASGRPVGR